MRKLRGPGQQAGTEPGDEKEKGFAGRETGALALLEHQGHGQGRSQKVIIMQIRAREGRENEQHRRGTG
jgi:hypothetical protein